MKSRKCLAALPRSALAALAPDLDRFTLEVTDTLSAAAHAKGASVRG